MIKDEPFRKCYKVRPNWTDIFCCTWNSIRVAFTCRPSSSACWSLWRLAAAAGDVPPHRRRACSTKKVKTFHRACSTGKARTWLDFFFSLERKWVNGVAWPSLRAGQNSLSSVVSLWTPRVSCPLNETPVRASCAVLFSYNPVLLEKLILLQIRG